MGEDGWRRWARSGALLAGVCAVAVLAVAGAARAATSSLLITYTTATSLQASLGDGTAVTSGSVVPAGSYMVTVKDDPNTGDLNPDLTISGPGVSLSNNLNSSGMGIDQTSTFGPYTFQAGSSYTIEDTTLGPSTLISFTVGGSSSGSATATTTTPAGQPSGTVGGSPSSSGTGSHSTAGGASSKTSKVLGPLAASVSATAKASLTLAGRAITTLKEGSYTVTVVDHSRTAGFQLGRVSKRAVVLSAAAGSSRLSRTVALVAGRWFFQASGGSKSYFTVTG